MRQRIFITQTPPAPVLEAFRAQFDVRLPFRDAPLSSDEIAQGVLGCQGLVSMLTDPISREILAAEPGLRVVANYAVGVNNIDLEAAKSLGIAVTNTPDVLTEATADLTFSLLLASARRIVEGDRLVRAGQWTGWSPTLLLGIELSGKCLGIIGMGRIGQAVARRALGFGMRVVYHNRTALAAERELTLGVRWQRLDDLLASADIISLHCPLTEATRNLLDAKAFARMRPGSYLINTARGEVVDEAAMIAALKSGHLAGAGLDVFTGEPRINPALVELPNVVLAPHLGSATHETRCRMGFMVLENVSAVLAGRTPPARVV